MNQPNWDEINRKKEQRIMFAGACNDAREYLLTHLTTPKGPESIDIETYTAACKHFYKLRKAAEQDIFGIDEISDHEKKEYDNIVNTPKEGTNHFNSKGEDETDKREKGSLL